MAENILAAACESETRNAAKRMRLDIYQAHVSLRACAVEIYLVLLFLLSSIKPYQFISL